MLSGLAEAGSFYPLLGSFTSLGLHDWGASSSKVLTQLRHNVVESVSLIVSAIAFATTPEPFLGDATGPPPSSSELPGAAAAEAEHPVMQAIIQLAGGATPEVFQSTRGSLIEVSLGHTSMPVQAGHVAVDMVFSWSGLIVVYVPGMMTGCASRGLEDVNRTHWTVCKVCSGVGQSFCVSTHFPRSDMPVHLLVLGAARQFHAACVHQQV